MQRGFKAEAERLANLVRDEMGIGRYKPLDIDALVRHVGAQRRTADELTTLTKLHERALSPRAHLTSDPGKSSSSARSPPMSGNAVTPAMRPPTSC